MKSLLQALIYAVYAAAIMGVLALLGHAVSYVGSYVLGLASASVIGGAAALSVRYA